MSAPLDVVHLRAADVSLVLDCTGDRLPRVLHWGADLGSLDDDDLEALRLASLPPIVSAQPDVVVPLSLLPEQSAGWLGTPGLTGHRAGAGFSTAFAVTRLDVEAVDGDPVVAHRVRVEADDTVAGLGLAIDIELAVSGVLRLRAGVENTGSGTFDLNSLDLALPVPAETAELVDLTGRHLRERVPQRAAFTLGTHLHESRRARAHDASLMVAGTRGFGWRRGRVWALHIGWSGNTRVLAERTSTGVSVLAGGELLLAGEIRLEPAQRYTGPWLYASTGEGLDELAGRLHTYLRSRPTHPKSARPVLLNVWEAVYFDHDPVRLRELAELAASVGVERFVLDDGWFGSRRDATSGLGDWVVSPEAWPDGLGPLVGHVHALGMQFGLWVEPEMVSPDSDLARAHPEWILATGGRMPVPARHQQVLDLAHDGAYRHVRDQLLAILDEYRIDYLKWDHNRDLVEAGHQPADRAGVHEQTLAAYRLIDEIRAAHPQLEIESCAGGGGRADLGMLERTDRIWGSDCIDPLERQQIEAGTSLLLPPELVGSHVGGPVSRTTRRSHTLDFRAGTAFLSHLGLEWDLTTADEGELDRLKAWVAAHKSHRQLLHTGRLVHDDQDGRALEVRGIVAADGAEAIYAVVAVATGPFASPGRICLPGLFADMWYRVRPLPPGDTVAGRRTGNVRPPWWDEGIVLPGAVLTTVGVQVPALNPEQMVLLHLARA